MDTILIKIFSSNELYLQFRNAIKIQSDRIKETNI